MATTAGRRAVIAGTASIRYSNPFFFTSRPTANTSGTSRGTPRRERRSARDATVWLETLDVHTVRHDLDPSGFGAERDGAAREIFAACRDRARPRERGPCRRTRGRHRLGDVDIGSMQADDQRQPRCRQRRRDAARDQPVSIHDRRVIFPRDAAGGPPPLRQGERRDQHTPRRARRRLPASTTHTRRCSTTDAGRICRNES